MDIGKRMKKTNNSPGYDATIEISNQLRERVEVLELKLLDKERFIDNLRSMTRSLGLIQSPNDLDRLIWMGDKIRELRDELTNVKQVHRRRLASILYEFFKVVEESGKGAV